ncbi:hypothetical protein F4604DRAFT_1794074 [Suillus subluteus]|nr:hypothetical protein F4604DRAFT_1794074 [Suillus subluteus]
MYLLGLVNSLPLPVQIFAAIIAWPALNASTDISAADILLYACIRFIETSKNPKVNSANKLTYLYLIYFRRLQVGTMNVLHEVRVDSSKQVSITIGVGQVEQDLFKLTRK